MDRLALTISYDGTDFAGSQVQPCRRTVQGELERALAELFGGPQTTVFAGRTDRGVHAAGQVVGVVDGRPDLPPGTIRAALNASLPDDVAVVGVEQQPPEFHPRYDARWREYRYRIWVGPRQPLARAYSWQRREDLDTGEMATGAMLAIGEHDFATFAGAGEGVPWSGRSLRPRGTVRTVLRADCVELRPWWGPLTGRLVELRVVADGFLPQMVRNLAAALVEIGQGKQPSSWIGELLTTRDRRAGPTTAPAMGLTLWRVGYGNETPDDEDTMAHPVHGGRTESWPGGDHGKE